MIRKFSTFSRAHTRLTIGLMPGDGIGQEVISGARQVLEKLSKKVDLKFKFVELEVGFKCFEKTGLSISDETLNILKNECDSGLFGATFLPSYPIKGYVSPSLQLQKKFNLHASITPIKSTNKSDKKFDLLFVRENNKSVFTDEKKVFKDNDGFYISESIKKVSEKQAMEISKLAFDIALKRKHIKDQPSITIAHRSNFFPKSDGLFLDASKKVYEYNRSLYGNVKFKEILVDTLIYHLIKKPDEFDVILAPNMYSDTLTKGCAALVDSVGIIPSLNIGNNFFIGEPYHGSAPDIQGQEIANPIGAIKSAAMMLEIMGFLNEAKIMNHAVSSVLNENKVLTQDLGGKATTGEMISEIIKNI